MPPNYTDQSYGAISKQWYPLYLHLRRPHLLLHSTLKPLYYQDLDQYQLAANEKGFNRWRKEEKWNRFQKIYSYFCCFFFFVVLKLILGLQRKLRNGTCRAEFSTDVPIGVAIGACILNSLVFPITSPPEDDESDSVIDSADTRFAVMGIISFIPYFNWLVSL